MGNQSSSEEFQNNTPHSSSSISSSVHRLHWTFYSHHGHHTINLEHNTQTNRRILTHNSHTLVNCAKTASITDRNAVYTWNIPEQRMTVPTLLNEPQPDFGRIVTFDAAGNELSVNNNDSTQQQQQSYIHTHTHSTPTKLSVIIRYNDFRYIYGLKINSQPYHEFIKEFYNYRVKRWRFSRMTRMSGSGSEIFRRAQLETRRRSSADSKNSNLPSTPSVSSSSTSVPTLDEWLSLNEEDDINSAIEHSVVVIHSPELSVIVDGEPIILQSEFSEMSDDSGSRHSFSVENGLIQCVLQCQLKKTLETQTPKHAIQPKLADKTHLKPIKKNSAHQLNPSLQFEYTLYVNGRLIEPMSMPSWVSASLPAFDEQRLRMMQRKFANRGLRNESMKENSNDDVDEDVCPLALIDRVQQAERRLSVSSQVAIEQVLYKHDRANR